MRYELLGTSGLRVSELCLGMMTFGGDWGWGADKADVTLPESDELPARPATHAA